MPSLEVSQFDEDGVRVLGLRGEANPTVLRLFALTGMDRTFRIVPDRKAALADAG